MKRPSFQFYPADWRNNAKLRRCSEAARGAWIDVLCVLHDSDEYGVLRWPLADIARAAGVPLKLLKELADKDVLKGGDKGNVPYIYTPRHAGKAGEPVVLVQEGNGPCWYCSRFVRDEYVRQRRGDQTRFDGTEGHTKKGKKSEPKPSPKVGFGEAEGDGSTSTSTSSIKNNESEGAAPEAHLTGSSRITPIPDGFPDKHTLDTYLTTAGVPIPSASHLQALVVEFRLHYAGQHHTETQWYGKLVASIRRQREKAPREGSPRAAGQGGANRHTGFDSLDYTAGLTEGENNGTHRF